MPDKSRSVFEAYNIQARPEEHEALIKRQGQVSRIINARKCPCIKNGQASVFCVICRGRGILYNFQKTFIKNSENSPHIGNFECFPLATPVVRSLFVGRCLPDFQGGPLEYRPTGTDGTKCTFEAMNPGDPPPKEYETLKHTYEWSIESQVEDENSTHTAGSYLLKTIATKKRWTAEQKIVNAYDIHGDITDVSRVYNVTKNLTYMVKLFFKNSILIDDVNGSVQPPLVTDVLSVDYKYIEPPRILVGRIDLKNALMKWGEDFKQGDIEAIVPGSYFMSRGDIVTLLTPQFRGDEVIVRGKGRKDELPQFDVIETRGEIIDEDGIHYDNSKWELQDYNDLYWKVGQGPAIGKKYSVSYIYRPTYQVYNHDIDMIAKEDHRFPHTIHLRFFNKFSKLDNMYMNLK
jgi:hypothetical protein